ncbi:hypothetical protein UC35_18345 [Ramlibacter tataouinensis]|uniref:Uncharacterized protein n=1 Tax=Ramlibacter tataouinensis TaxID=94132 RepID=A0A127JWQ0_9BURK|nr:hypothetical protein UC35_18345 [Ramlibacter tataouinensis]
MSLTASSIIGRAPSAHWVPGCANARRRPRPPAPRGRSSSPTASSTPFSRRCSPVTVWSSGSSACLASMTPSSTNCSTADRTR